MSGTIVVETALQAPQTILQVIGIDNMRDIGSVVGPEEQASYDSFYTRAKLQFRDVVQKEMGPYLFAASTDSTIRLKVLGDILQGDPIRSMDILAAGDQYPLTQKLKMYAKPIYLIQADYIPTDPSLFQKEGIPVRIRTIKNCGHYPMVEHPEEFNSALEATILQVQ
jgi:pimeloyl-ACP methyl ester carboxylesterase